MKIRGSSTGGYTLIEMVVVAVLLAILAAFSFKAIILSSETYTITVRDYLELFKEGFPAMEKMTRELRETNPARISIAAGWVAFTKAAGHDTPQDSSLSVIFTQSGDIIERRSGAGNHRLTGNVVSGSFTATMNAQSVVTLSFTLEGDRGQIPFRSAVHPRQRPTPIPTPTPVS